MCNHGIKNVKYDKIFFNIKYFVPILQPISNFVARKCNMYCFLFVRIQNSSIIPKNTSNCCAHFPIENWI